MALLFDIDEGTRLWREGVPQTNLKLTPEEIEYLRRKTATMAARPTEPVQTRETYSQFQERMAPKYAEQERTLNAPIGILGKELGFIPRPVSKFIRQQLPEEIIERNPQTGEYSQILAAVNPDLTGGVFKGKAAKKLADIPKVLKTQAKASAGGKKAVEEAAQQGVKVNPPKKPKLEPLQPPKAKAATKQPWEMTAKEYGQKLVDDAIAEQTRLAVKYKDDPQMRKVVEQTITNLKKRDPLAAATAENHAFVVHSAQELGNTVPPEVLKDYPDLVKAAQQSTPGATNWVQQNLDVLYQEAERRGVVDRIVELSKQRKTAKEVADALKLPKATASDPFAGTEATSLVRAVRNKLGIPSMDDKAAFDAWLASTQQGIPTMITRQMEADLKARGLSQADINKLTPQQAWDTLNTPTTPRGGTEVPPPSQAAGVPPPPAATASVPPIEPPKGPPTATTNADDFIRQFGEYLESPEVKRRWTEVEQLRKTERGSRIRAFSDSMAKNIDAGMPPDEAFKIAKAGLAGEYSKGLLKIGDLIPESARPQFYAKIQEVLKDEPWEIVSTTKAFENALANDAIPRVKGTKGGSAYDRLVRVFGRDFVDRVEAATSLDMQDWGPISPTDWSKPLVDAMPGTPKQFDLFHPTTNAKPITPWQKRVNSTALFLYYQGLLSGPKTHIVNATSSVVNALVSPIERFGAAAIDVPLALARKGHQRERFFGEAGADVFGFFRGVPEGLRNALNAWNNSPAAAAAKYDLPLQLQGKWGKRVGWPTRAMITVDEFFKAANMRAALSAEAWRAAKKTGKKGQAFIDELNGIMAKPTGKMITDAIERSEERLFRSELGKVGKTLTKLVDTEVLGGFTPFRFILPFIRTPGNLIKFGLKRTPLGLLDVDVWRNLVKGNPKAAEQLANVFMGTAVMAGIYIYSKDGLITGAPPINRAERERFYAMGKQPYSIKIGNKWVSYQRAEPFNWLFTQVAAVDDAMQKGDASAVEKAQQIALTLASNMTSQSYVSSIGDVVNALEEPDRFGERFINRMSGNLVPYGAAVRTAEQIVSPEIEQPSNPLQYIQSGIPGLSESVPKKVNAFGEEVKRETTQTLIPYSITTAKDEPYLNELERLKVNINVAGDTIKDIRLTSDEAQTYRLDVGRQVKESIEALMSTPQYTALTTAERASRVRSVVNQAKEDALDRYIMNSDFTIPHAGDSVEQRQRRVDLSRVGDYLRYTQDIRYDKAQNTVRRALRFLDPNMDVALRMTGYTTSVSDRAGTAELLKDRQNGIYRQSEFSVTPQVVEQVKQRIVPYYDIEITNWQAAGAQAYLLWKEANRLENAGDKAGATRIRKANPIISFTYERILDEQMRMRQQDPVLDAYIKKFG